MVMKPVVFRFSSCQQQLYNELGNCLFHSDQFWLGKIDISPFPKWEVPVKTDFKHSQWGRLTNTVYTKTSIKSVFFLCTLAVFVWIWSSHSTPYFGSSLRSWSQYCRPVHGTRGWIESNLHFRLLFSTILDWWKVDFQWHCFTIRWVVNELGIFE